MFFSKSIDLCFSLPLVGFRRTAFLDLADSTEKTSNDLHSKQFFVRAREPSLSRIDLSIDLFVSLQLRLDRSLLAAQWNSNSIVSFSGKINCLRRSSAKERAILRCRMFLPTMIKRFSVSPLFQVLTSMPFTIDRVVITNAWPHIESSMLNKPFVFKSIQKVISLLSSVDTSFCLSG